MTYLPPDEPASQEYLGTITENQPSPMWGDFLGATGLEESAISKYIANLLGGRGVEERGTAYGQNLLKDVNRTYGGMYDTLRGQMATTGGRHSSAEAKLLSEGIHSYQGSRLDADQQRLAYEDALRREMFGQGQGLMGMMTGMKQGDIGNTLSWLSTLSQGYGIEMTEDQLMALLMSIDQPYGDTTETVTSTG